MTNALYTPTDADPRARAAVAAAAALRTLDASRCDLYDAQQAGTRPPAPPALTADAIVDAYGHAMNKPDARFMSFAEWWEQQQTPQPRGRYIVVGSNY